jgi:hypothetical protein
MSRPFANLGKIPAAQKKLSSLLRDRPVILNTGQRSSWMADVFEDPRLGTPLIQ